MNTSRQISNFDAMAVPVQDADTAFVLDALRVLQLQPKLTQRQLSHELGLSLGKTHYLLRALLDQGLLKAQNFKRSDNKIAYSYLLTPKGIREKLLLTRSFLARKEAEFERLQATIVRLRMEVQGSRPAEFNN
jgi:EPS-associated MarR family transcriptional regulator